MTTLDAVLEFLKSVTLLTVSQLISIFGILFIFGLVLYFLARNTRRVYMKSVGSTLDIIVTGWIGTPVHELGHAIFCLIFFHKIERIKLFDPNPKDGSIGYVIHSYDRKNIWHRIGNFFIGVGPIIFGSIVLYAAMYYLVPNIKGVFSEIKKHGATISSLELSNWQFAYKSLLDAVTITLKALSNPANFTEWQFWLFIYLSMSIASHMELSPPDLKGALGGFITLALFIFFLNLFVMVLDHAGLNKVFGSFWKYINLQTYMGSIARVTGIATALFIYATIISAINFVVSWLLLSIYTLIRHRRVINPFWG
ncbi:MAG: hypothetical protein IH597_10040 [Bacteroidales bacterium]|nr:hypothetical protein [Bacteroidales bacterium]